MPDLLQTEEEEERRKQSLTIRFFTLPHIEFNYPPLPAPPHFASEENFDQYPPHALWLFSINW